MHEFIHNISNTIDSQFKISKSNDSITIEEKENTDGCKKVTIILNRKNVFSFNLDLKRNRSTNFRTFQFFNPSTSGISMINDGILAIVEDNNIIFLLFELKSNSFDFKDIRKKMKNAEYFCCYIIDIINEHFSKNYKRENLIFKSILVTTNTSKTTTIGKKKISFTKKGKIEKFASVPCNREYRIEAFI